MFFSALALAPASGGRGGGAEGGLGGVFEAAKLDVLKCLKHENASTMKLINWAKYLKGGPFHFTGIESWVILVSKDEFHLASDESKLRMVFNTVRLRLFNTGSPFLPFLLSARSFGIMGVFPEPFLSHFCVKRYYLRLPVCGSYLLKY